MRAHVEEAYVSQTSFTLQRYMLERIVQLSPEYAGLSLIRHCYSCNYEESVTIRNLIMKGV